MSLEGSPVPGALLDRTVLDLDGAERRLGDIGAGDRALLVFLRHFGCVGCEVVVDGLVPRLPELTQAGLRVLFIGNGSSDQARFFAERHAIVEGSARLLTDPGRGSYEAAGLRRSAAATLSPVSLAHEVVLGVSRGFLPGRIRGDAFQQGGVVLVDGDGMVRLHRVNRSPTDHARAGEIVDCALRIFAADAGSKSPVL